MNRGVKMEAKVGFEIAAGRDLDPGNGRIKLSQEIIGLPYTVYEIAQRWCMVLRPGKAIEEENAARCFISSVEKHTLKKRNPDTGLLC
jgi:hypothetical protein